jgi:DNA invertase Pin-like site-specific DNA recombinase
MIIKYLRTSTLEQGFDRQEEILKGIEAEKVFTDKVSGKERHRPGLDELLDFIRPGDKIYISEFGRIARDTQMLLELIDYITKEKQCELHSVKENLDTGSATGKLLVTMIAAINEFELNQLDERRHIGIQIAKEKGRYKGRAKLQVPAFDELYNKYLSREIKSKTELAKVLGISRRSLYNILEEKGIA